MEEMEKGFFDQYIDDFDDYLQSHRKNKIHKRKDYQKLQNKIKFLKGESPNVESFLEDSNTTELSEKDMESLLKVIYLEREINRIEEIECFKLGFREAYIFFRQMDLLKI